VTHAKRTVLRELLDAAARVARDDSIVGPLVRSTGLSPENVRLGLDKHLETSATDAELDALIGSVSSVSRVHVILSPSVFVAPLRAIALAMAASDHVTVKPSKREPEFARLLVAALGSPRVMLAPDVTPEDVLEGEIHVDGRDDTITAIRSRASVPVRGHGHGMGVALVTGDFVRAAEALVSDIVPFDQRGCLSPRVVFVVGDAPSFARLLFDALEQTTIPRGALDSGETPDLAWWASTVEYAGVLHRGVSCAVGTVSSGTPIPPSGRHVLVRGLDSPAALNTALGDDARFVIAVGSDEPAASFAPLHARVSALGHMQRPPLDGPVDRR
jgi:hypothetical protein